MSSQPSIPNELPDREREERDEASAEKEADAAGCAEASYTPTETPPCARYGFPRRIADPDLAVPDLVWGKVLGYPWWPGQVLDPSYASRMALRHRKHGRLLVAYFVDRTFAWSSPSQLKPFLPHFEEMERQSNSPMFLSSVRAAVAEVGRRVEAELASSSELHSDLKWQRLENAGIRKGVAMPILDVRFGPLAFVPKELVQYIRTLAVCPICESGTLDLAMARAHLMAYQRWKGYRGLCTFSESRGPLEDETASVGDDGSTEMAERSVWVPMDEDKLADFMAHKLGQRRLVNTICSKRKGELVDISGRQSRRMRKKKKKKKKIGSSGDHKSGNFVHASKLKNSLAASHYVRHGKKRRSESEEEITDVMDESFKVGGRFPTKLIDSSPIMKKSNGVTSQKEAVEEGSLEGYHSDANEIAGLPGDIKYSRRNKAKAMAATT